MLHEKRKDLDVERQKNLLARLVTELSRSNPELYYRSTSEIALLLKQQIASGEELSVEERAILVRLSQRDIQILLSLI